MEDLSLREDRLQYGRSLGHGYALFLGFFAEFSSAKLDNMYHKYQFQSVMFLWGAKETTFFGPFISVLNCNVTIITSVAFLNTRKKWRLRRHFCSLRLPIETSIGIRMPPKLH